MAVTYFILFSWCLREVDEAKQLSVEYGRSIFGFRIENEIFKLLS